MQSLEGEGRLTFFPGYQCKTEAEHALWVRGPINASKDGAVPLESVIDTSILPGTLTLHWRLTRPGQTLRFEAGEPFCTILPYPKAGLDEVTVEVVPLTGGMDDYERALESLAESQALESVFERLSAGEILRRYRGAGGGLWNAKSRTAKSRWAGWLPMPPAVTCICATQGRVELLEEAIHSFLRQDYPGAKELLVLNDTEGQTLVYDHPEVQVVNVPRRFHSAAEKLKAAVGLASHDLIFPWPEDDVCLPHRLSFTVAHLAPETVFWKADKVWLWNGDELGGPEPEAPSWRHALWRQLLAARNVRQSAGLPHAGTDDAGGFEALCAGEGPGAVHLQAVEPEEVYSIRRGEAGNGHEHAGRRHGIPRGSIQLRPRWRRDYGALVQEHLGIPLPAERPPSGGDPVSSAFSRDPAAAAGSRESRSGALLPGRSRRSRSASSCRPPTSPCCCSAPSSSSWRRCRPTARSSSSTTARRTGAPTSWPRAT